ncbi:MAG: AraC family transcriptional regulator [Clostridia bacterium]|nr:AraC family transcriptional regulator [Clostridia bacterium]
MWKLYKKESSFGIDGLYSVFFKTVKDGFLFPGEVHDFWEMMYCMKGSATVSAGERVFTLKENQIVFFHPMEFHSFRVEREIKSNFFIASFEISGDLTDRLSNRIFELGQEHIRVINEIFNRLRQCKTDINEDHPAAFLNALSETPYSLNVITNMFENLVISLSREDSLKAHLVKNQSTRIYANALRLIDENLSEKITVETLSKKCNVSSTYLKDLFKKYNGLGVHEYILKIKILHAKQMLQNGETVTETAEKSGFASQTYFSTAFKRETGFSPSKYK